MLLVGHRYTRSDLPARQFPAGACAQKSSYKRDRSTLPLQPAHWPCSKGRLVSAPREYQYSWSTHLMISPMLVLLRRASTEPTVGAIVPLQRYSTDRPLPCTNFMLPAVTDQEWSSGSHH